MLMSDFQYATTLERRVDEAGNVTYTNLPPRKGGALHSSETPTQPNATVKKIPPLPSSPAATDRPNKEAPIASATQASRDQERVRILEVELRRTEYSLEEQKSRKSDPAAIERLEADLSALRRELDRARK
jgi:hypothetical protein